MQKAQVRGKTRGRLGHGGCKTKQGHGLAIERGNARTERRGRRHVWMRSWGGWACGEEATYESGLKASMAAC